MGADNLAQFHRWKDWRKIARLLPIAVISRPGYDDDAFAEVCVQGLALGFDGKTLIHPKTISVANNTFGPSKEAVEKARAIVSAFEEAKKQGQGVVVLDGRLIENLHADEARRLIAYSDAIAALEQSAS